MKVMKLQYFSIFTYIWWVLKLLVFFVRRVDKKPNILTKRRPVATTVPSGTNNIIGALVYRIIPSDLRSRPEQSYHIPEALLSR